MQRPWGKNPLDVLKGQKKGYWILVRLVGQQGPDLTAASRPGKGT